MSITVKTLIKQLSKLDPDAQVILQKDPEGNGYSPLAGSEQAVYSDDTVYSLEYTHKDNCMEKQEWEDLKKSKKNKCVVLWPTR